MNLLKSLFIFVAPVLLIFIVVQGAMIWLDSKSVLVSLGVVFSALPLLLFLSYIMLFRKLARTDRHLLAVSIPTIIGLLLVSIGGFDNTALVLSVSGVLITAIYVYWYSDNGRQHNNSLGEGELLPEFMLKDLGGNDVSSESFQHKKSLIFFYRGNWCPLCMAQIDEVADQYQKFKDNNVDVIFISPQPSKNTNNLANRFNLDFRFFIDKHNKAAKQLGIFHEFGLPMGFQVLGYESHSVYPTIIALNDRGEIIYSDQTSNYRVRPEPEELLKLFTR